MYSQGRNRDADVDKRHVDTEGKVRMEHTRRLGWTYTTGLPRRHSGEEPTCQRRRCK